MRDSTAVLDTCRPQYGQAIRETVCEMPEISLKATVQQMSEFPEERITPSRPFTHTGLKLAKPLTI